MKRFRALLTHTRSRAALLAVILLSTLSLSGASCGGTALTAPDPVVLKVWRSEDSQENFQAAMTAYTAQYPHVSFEYRVFQPEEYEAALLSAWAKGEGPDIFSIPNNEVGNFQQYIAPMPKNASFAYSYTKKSFGRTQTVVAQRDVTFLVPSQIRDQFAPAVGSDVIIDNAVYGLPYALDTMVLYYNRDMLSKAQVAVPPATWEDYRNAVQTITRRDEQKNILQAGGSIGTANNVPYFFDIISAIMMQNGTQMVTPSGQVAFAEEVNGNLRGAETVDFYTKFANPEWQTYTWNATEPDSRSAFIDGRTALFFGYGRDQKRIQQQAPNLNFSYSALPQIDLNNRVDYASYMVEVVHLGSKNPEHAWNFIQTIATTDQGKVFADAIGRTPARLVDIAALKDDPDRGVFAKSALTARTWYHGQDSGAAVAAFKELVENVLAKTGTVQDLVNIAAQKVALSWQAKTE